MLEASRVSIRSSSAFTRCYATTCPIFPRVAASAAVTLHAPFSAFFLSPPVRLARRVNELFGCSRAEAEQYICNGRVMVEDDMIEAPQHKVTAERLEFDPEARLEAVKPAMMLLHKPFGFDAIDGRSAANGAGQTIDPARSSTRLLDAMRHLRT
ncbi:MAG: hypothetical protein ACTHOH_16545 [Lysobacteraceae bacterium]